MATEETKASPEPFSPEDTHETAVRAHQRIDALERTVQLLTEQNKALATTLLEMYAKQAAPPAPPPSAPDASPPPNLSAHPVKLDAKPADPPPPPATEPEGLPCPDHPDAPQTDGRCNAPLCDYRQPRP